MTVVGVDPKRVSQHVAIVMDGDGRWAQRQGLKPTEGHAAGEEALFDTVASALDLGIKWLTLTRPPPRTGSALPMKFAT